MRFKGLFLVLSLVAMPLGMISAGGFSVDSASGLNQDGLLEDGATLTIWIHMTQDYADVVHAIDNGWWLYDEPDGSLSWGAIDTAKNDAYDWCLADGWPCLFDMGFFGKLYGDTVGFGGAVFTSGIGLVNGWDDWAYKIIVGPITVIEEPAKLWIDSCYIPPSSPWEWSVSMVGPFEPDWAGPYCWSTVEGPCICATGVDEFAGGQLPTEFGLRQNYPNPFNPNTHIRFDVPSKSHVSIDVFNALGQKVRTLVNETRSAGSYTVEWDGRNDNGTAVSTGVYLYRLEAGNYVQTKKAILMK